MEQKKMTPGSLLDERGRLTEPGYAFTPVKQYDRKAVKAGRLRIKEWDYYLVTNRDYGVAITVADNAYMGLASLTLLDFRAGSQVTVSPMLALPLGRLRMPASSETGDVVCRGKGFEVVFRRVGTVRHLSARFKNLEKGQPVAVDIELFDEPRDSMVIATPFPKKPTAFYYNRKIIGMRARGEVRYRGETFAFSPEDSFGLLDWGRGVWTYKNTWYWGAGQGLVDGAVFGFNLGYGFGDTSSASENMLFYQGLAHKLDDVTFQIPVDQAGRDDFLKPWRFSSSDGRFEADFTPILDRAALTSLGVLCSDQHQVFGLFNGTATLDDGRVLRLRDFLGFAEKVYNKW
ncbi:MAG TPA: DUF2804 domain-containing protein [Spirochaetaceae bacterium]|nr:DUF2804 domain-containing protein [Spirochaetaceae bacterium]HAX37519.1 DUF2804 domain-containing protein [Spirochaetaceae bacterium]HBO40672.1 DUF2804 domain-containing protein [Spirochaetaceae bacterium]HCQ88217.1 DUF2804 domain-containing protein [Spirochaetaceae bacterium]